jgi:hypothetical protein
MGVFHILKKAIHYTPQNLSVGTPNVQFIGMNSMLIAESGYRQTVIPHGLAL